MTRMEDWARATAIMTFGALASACFDPSSTESTEGTGGTAESTGPSATQGDDGDDGGSMTTASTSSPTGPSTDPTTGDTTGDPTGDPSGVPTSDTGDTSGDTTGDTTGETTGGAEMCGAGETCVPEAPVGWSGPAAVYRGSDPAPSCPATQPAIGFTATADLDAPEATCGCECGDAQGFTCTATVRANGSGCLAFCLTCPQWTLDSGECTSISTSSTHFAANDPVLNTAGASCAPNGSENVPEATWGAQVQGCDVPEEAPACDGGRCTATPADPYGSMCIYTDGDAMCPEGPYTEREVVFTGFTDDRACSECTCGTPEGTCGGDFAFTSGCGGLPILYGTVDAGSCGNIGDQHNAVSYGADPDVSCPPQGGEPTGGAAGTGPITMCCLP